jgi:hypothetical protein
MADFITTKANGDSLDASEWNQLEEIDNAIDSSGLTLTTAQKDQLKISMARYASGANFYTDGGSANAYVLTSISHGGGKSFAPAGAGAVNYFNGMNVKFRPANNNSGASTVNVSSFGSKDIRKSNGTSALTGGELTTATDVILRYDSTNSCFIIQEYAKATTTNQGVSYLNNPITITNNATDANNDIDFSAGNAPLDDYSGQVLLASTLVKRLDASWSAGTNQGGLFSGTKANSTRYYLFSITNGTIIDAGFDISPTGANIPAGYKGSYRGMVLTDGSGNIRPFTLAGQYMSYVNEIVDYTPTTPTSDVYITYALSCPLKPNILAYIRMAMLYTGASVVAQDFNYRNTGQSSGNFFGGGAVNGYQAQNPTGFVPLNSLAQVDLLFRYTAPSSNFSIITKGYFDFNIKL